MRISTLSLTLGLIFASWCLFGIAIHSWKIMLYPFGWAIIIAGFYLLNRSYDRKHRTYPKEAVVQKEHHVVEKKQPIVSVSKHDTAIAN